MSDHDENDRDPVIGRALDAWTPMEPPTGFVDRVLAARVPVAPRISPVKRALWIAAPLTAVAAIVLVMFATQQDAKMATNPAAGNVASKDYANGDSVQHVGVAAGSGSAVAVNQPYVADAGIAVNGQMVSLDDAETDIAIIAGTSATIHDPSPVTALHVDFSALCPTGAEVIVLGAKNAEIARARGRTRAVLTFDAGTWPYEVRCDSDPRALPTTGTITIKRDESNRKLPKVTQRVNTIDADGRTWRVSYQTLLPQIRIKVPGATQVQYASGSIITDVEVVRGIATLPPLDEGTYTYWALAPSGRSKVSTLIIDFDRTTPQIYLGRIRSVSSGTMILDGAVLPGWTLAIGADPITIRKNLRFEATVRGFKRVVIRGEHPRHGVHYFATLPITR